MAALNYNHLRYFWLVAHEGNLTKAAAQLHVSQSSLSIQIQKLEEQLGHALFERRGKRLILTEAGKIALEHADVVFAAGDELLGTLRKGMSTRQVLRVGALATLSRNFQMEFLQPILGRDDIEIVLRSATFGDLLQRLEAHQIDVVLSNLAPPRDAATPWVVHRISGQPVSLVAHPNRARGLRDLKRILESEPLILPSLESSIRVGFDALAQRLDIRPRIAAEVDDMAMLRLLVREDVGIAVVPPIVVKDELDGRILRKIRNLPELSESFYAITLKRRFPNAVLGLLVPSRD